MRQLWPLYALVAASIGAASAIWLSSTGARLVAPVVARSGLQIAPQSAPAVDLAPHHLPAWVQTRQPAPLWSGPDKQAIQFTRLPAWTFLKVTGARADRLQVAYSGDGTDRQPGPGWVSASDVQPSDASGAWLRNHRATRLFADSDTTAAAVTVPQWSWMVRLDDASADDRLHVRVYAANFATIVGEGWLAVADVGPTDAPDQSVWTVSQKPTPATQFASHQDFIDAMGAAAHADATNSAPASITIAQAILESNWGQSLLSREANNYFGIKAMGELGNDGAVWMPTLEYSLTGGDYKILAPFRAYRSMTDSVADHSRLFRDLSIYRPALDAVNDPDEFARRIARAGYATDPAYAAKLIDLMHRYELYRFDFEARRAAPPQSPSG